MHGRGYDPALLIRNAKRAGLLAMAALPVELYASKRKQDARRREAARIQAAEVSEFPVMDAIAPQPDGAWFGPQGGPGSYPDAGLVNGVNGLNGFAGRDAFTASAPSVAGGEERKHHPEFLVEPDREGMFGSDALTAPPVIGDE